MTITIDGETSVLDSKYDYKIPSLLDSGRGSEYFTIDSDIFLFSTPLRARVRVIMCIQ